MAISARLRPGGFRDGGLRPVLFWASGIAGPKPDRFFPQGRAAAPYSLSSRQRIVTGQIVPPCACPKKRAQSRIVDNETARKATTMGIGAVILSELAQECDQSRA